MISAFNISLGDGCAEVETLGKSKMCGNAKHGFLNGTKTSEVITVAVRCRMQLVSKVRVIW
jgi:hypothetical protein